VFALLTKGSLKWSNSSPFLRYFYCINRIAVAFDLYPTDLAYGLIKTMKDDNEFLYFINSENEYGGGMK
jgi:hypothetical protein